VSAAVSAVCAHFACALQSAAANCSGSRAVCELIRKKCGARTALLERGRDHVRPFSRPFTSVPGRCECAQRRAPCRGHCRKFSGSAQCQIDVQHESMKKKITDVVQQNGDSRIGGKFSGKDRNAGDQKSDARAPTARSKEFVRRLLALSSNVHRMYAPSSASILLILPKCMSATVKE